MCYAVNAVLPFIHRQTKIYRALQRCIYTYQLLMFNEKEFCNSEFICVKVECH